MILACDPATVHFGLAIGGAGDRAPRAWSVRLPGADDLVFDRTLGCAADTVATLCRAHGVKIVAIEKPMLMDGGGMSTAQTIAKLLELCGAVRATAHRAGCQIVLRAPSTVRKHFAGHGRPKDPKRAVMARCDQLGWAYTDDNAADAAALWSLAMSEAYRGWPPI